MTFSLRRLLIGDPLRTSEAGHQRLSNFIALPIFASDALSSVAFATEEMMAALLIAGALPYFGLTPFLAAAVAVLLAVVVVSYRQTLAAYPVGGGAYTVAGENLSPRAGRTAGAALLLDYVLNAAVCASAGVAAIVSLVSNYGVNIERFTVPLALGFLVLIALLNLRGAKESGAVFAVLVYGFVLITTILIVWGFYLMATGGWHPIHSASELAAARVGGDGNSSDRALAPFGIFLLLHAFSSGCTALTGVEAISNGVQAFRDPAPVNASKTMVWMAFLLGGLFIGVSILAARGGALPPNAAGYHETVLSQVGRVVFGTGPLYLALQIATCAILVLSCNTSFAGFPCLSSLMAADGLLPRQLANIGDKLVFDRGIIALLVAAGALVVGFRGSVHALIPLFAIGVFLSFTLSQAGMVRHWLHEKSAGWRAKLAVNAVGASATAVVTVVFAIVKFRDGAWMILILIPALVLLFGAIRHHYDGTTRQLSLEGYCPRQAMRHHVLVLVPDLHRGVIPALQYARSISSDARAIHVSIDPEKTARLQKMWPLYSRGILLQTVESPYRALAAPVLAAIDLLQRRDPNCLVTLVIPEAIPNSWWAGALHGQTALMLLWKLRSKPGVVAVNVPYHVDAWLDNEEIAAE
ncbi:APC family permease [Abditibacterium utsteinense]|nr:APC family permease [Abditibacterium utsteinense]